MSKTKPPLTDAVRAGSFRLTIAYERAQLSLVSVERLDGIAPPSDPLDRIAPGADRSGFWVEIRDRNGKLLYRRGMSSPIRTSVELIDPHSQMLQRVPIVDVRGRFFIRVPALARTQKVVLYSSPLETPYAAAAEIAAFDLE